MLDESDPVNDRSCYRAWGHHRPPDPPPDLAGHLCNFLGDGSFQPLLFSVARKLGVASPCFQEFVYFAAVHSRKVFSPELKTSPESRAAWRADSRLEPFAGGMRPVLPALKQRGLCKMQTLPARCRVSASLSHCHAYVCLMLCSQCGKDIKYPRWVSGCCAGMVQVFLSN